jgi:hypothetical protein
MWGNVYNVGFCGGLGCWDLGAKSEEKQGYGGFSCIGGFEF